MPKYEFKKGWKRWKAGDVIDAYEYKRLPIEIKVSLIKEVEEAPALSITRLEVNSDTAKIPLLKLDLAEPDPELPVPKMESTVEEKLSSFDPKPEGKEEIKRVVKNYFKPQ